jgi:hypothetical protein
VALIGAIHRIEPCGKKNGAGRLIGRTKGGMNTTLHTVTAANGHPICFFKTAGQVSDYIGAAALLKEWRRVATRYDRCPNAFFLAIALVATVIFWL